MLNIDKTVPVMVTGATGYVAGWLVERLLAQGVTVHAPVRNPDNKEAVSHLQAMADASGGKIVFFKADLLAEGSYDDAAKGCQVMFHTASPFIANYQDAQKELIDPAVLGTRNLLNTANRVASIRRVVVTSSCAAVFGDSVDAQDRLDNTLTEADWNSSSSLQHNPYHYSKLLAERAAWEMHGLQQQQGHERWELVTINPAFVIGPGTKVHAASESFAVIRQMGDGTMKAGIPDMAISTVDVRDLADAHLQAGFNPAAAGRHIISGCNTTILDMASSLQDKYGASYPLPKRLIPKWVVWLFAPLSGMTRQYASRNIGYPLKLDNRKSIDSLGLSYRPLQASMEDFFEQLIDAGQL